VVGGVFMGSGHCRLDRAESQHAGTRGQGQRSSPGRARNDL